jgi:hypothetical protein
VTRELAVLERLRRWDGLSRLEAILSDKKREANFFRIASRVVRVEGVHSDLLAWLFDPRGWHGLKDGFVAPFIREMLDQTNLGFDGPISNVVVDKEYSTGEGPIDVLVRLRVGDRPVVVGVENKIDAPLGDEQLVRYARGLVTKFSNQAVVLVLLAPDDPDADAPEVQGCEFTSTTYRRVVAHLKAALGAHDDRHEPGIELARHYLETLRTTIVPEPQPAIDRILQEMLAEHQEAWRLIRRRLPSESDDNHAAFAGALCHRLAEKYGAPWQFNLRRTRYVRVFRPGWTCVGRSEAEPVIGINHSAFAPSHYPQVHFRLTARPDDDGNDAWHGIAKLRVKADRDQAALGRLTDALDAGGFLKPDMRGRSQFTIDRKQTSKLTAIERGVVPDSTVDWFMRALEPLIGVVDECLGKDDDRR